MTKKDGFMVLAVIALFAVYAIYFSNWFKPKTFDIFHTYRDLHAGPARPGTMPSLIFGLTRQLPLNDVRVVSAEGLATNKNILPLWHLMSDSNSIPMKTFFYGQFIRGMHPAFKGTHPEMLETNISYLIIIRAGKTTSEHKFELK